MIVDGKRRRSWPLDLKRRIVEESCDPDVSICDVARRYDLDPSQLYAWRKRFREKAPSYSGLVPVEITDPCPPQIGCGGLTLSDQNSSHRIEIVLTNGRRLFVREDMDASQLTRFAQARRLMFSLPTGTKVWLAVGKTDMRKGFDGLSAIAQTVLKEDPLSGHVFVFRGRLGDRVKVLYWDGQGMVLIYKRLEKASFVWPSAASGKVSITPAQLSSLLEGMDWRLTRPLPSVPQPQRVV